MVLESGREDFIYLAIDNSIYKMYINENALKISLKNRNMKLNANNPHLNLEIVA